MRVGRVIAKKTEGNYITAGKEYSYIYTDDSYTIRCDDGLDRYCYNQETFEAFFEEKKKRVRPLP